MVCEDITLRDVRGAITVTSRHPKIPATDTAQPVTATMPHYRHRTFRNLTATNSTYAGVIVGLPESVIENVRLENVPLTAGQSGLEIRHAKGVQFKHVKVTPKAGPPFIVSDAEVTGSASQK